MKAVVFHDIGDIRLEDVPEPQIQEPTDAIVRITASAICGTDLHFVRGTVPGMQPGTILGHEAVGVVEELGPMVRNFAEGDRVLIVSTIACGYCSYCRAGYYAQCDTANPGGKRAGTAFFGGPSASGPFHGLQAERAHSAPRRGQTDTRHSRGTKTVSQRPGVGGRGSDLPRGS
jgi:threonine dehydrogenase-like Zn-dependent dehydrogenase